MKTQMFVQTFYDIDIGHSDPDVCNFFVEQFPGATSTLDLTEPSENWYLEQPSLSKLITGIQEQMVLYSVSICGHQGQGIQLLRVGVNMMQTGDFMEEHHHSFQGLVGIFYLSVPEYAAQLVLTDVVIQPQNNQLVMHNGHLVHRVTTHTPQEPRITLIVEAIER